MKEKLGIFGGTFAPIHNGHIRAVRAFCEQICPDQTVLMPAAIPPHKQPDATFTPQQRLEMTQLAAAECLSDLHVTVSDWELKRKEKSYTYHTLMHFSRPDRTLYFLMGTDMFLTLEEWYRGTELFALAHMVCAMREADLVRREQVLFAQEKYRARYDAQCEILTYVPMELSSTQVRQRIKNGQPLDGYVPSGVVEYIREHEIGTK